MSKGIIFAGYMEGAMDAEEKDRRIKLARYRAAQAWCQPCTKNEQMNPDLAEAFALILMDEMFHPKLGYATTRQLLAEITARIEVDGQLDYRTVGGEA